MCELRWWGPPCLVHNFVGGKVQFIKRVFCCSFLPHEDVENGELGYRNLIDQPVDKEGKGITRKKLFSAPADHGEGGGGEVQLGPGETGNTAKWYRAQVHLEGIRCNLTVLDFYNLPSNRSSSRVPFHHRVVAWSAVEIPPSLQRELSTEKMYPHLHQR